MRLGRLLPLTAIFTDRCPAGKEIFKGKAFGRRVRVQWEINPLHVDIEVLLQLFNTPGTEIAPRSNEVGEYFQLNSFSHNVSQTRRFSAAK